MLDQDQDQGRERDAVPSPCTKVCRIDANTGWCEGCLRTLAEIGTWSQLDNTTKLDVCKQLEERRLLFKPEPNASS